MRRKIAILWILVLCLCGNVFADVIFMPIDSFYHDHYEDCTRVEAYYTVNAPQGWVDVMESPESDGVVRQLQNGEEVYVTYIYHVPGEETAWGIGNDYMEDQKGWFPMTFLEPVYSEEDFRRDNAHRIEEKVGILNLKYLGKEIVFREYPGSSRIVDRYLLGKDWTGKDSWEVPSYSLYFEDDQGHRWGYVSYFYGCEGWLCLDEPVEEVPVEEKPVPEETWDSEETEQEGIRPIHWILTLGVSTVVGVTLGLLIAMKKREE